MSASHLDALLSNVTAIIHQGRLDADVELLTKPFTADALTRKVRAILDAQSVVTAEASS